MTPEQVQTYGPERINLISKLLQQNTTESEIITDFELTYPSAQPGTAREIIDALRPEPTDGDIIQCAVEIIENDRAKADAQVEQELLNEYDGIEDDSKRFIQEAHIVVDENSEIRQLETENKELLDGVDDPEEIQLPSISKDRK